MQITGYFYTPKYLSKHQNMCIYIIWKCTSKHFVYSVCLLKLWSKKIQICARLCEQTFLKL